MNPYRIAAAAAAAWVALLGAGCEPEDEGSSAILSAPVDFTWACEGPAGTTPPSLAADDGTLLPSGRVISCQGFDAPGVGAVNPRRLGLIVNQDPPGVSVFDLASGLAIDNDPFIPGFRPIPVGDAPIRILRAPDFGAFYILSAGSRDVTKLIIDGAVWPGRLVTRASRFDLPGVPSGGVILGDTLLVAAAWRPEIWRFDLRSAAPGGSVQIFTVDDIVDEMTVLPEVGDDPSTTPAASELLLTWTTRPVLTRMDADANLVAEVGLAPACADTIDNDGDGDTDAADGSCRGPFDRTEDDGTLRTASAAAPFAPVGGFAGGAALCSDGRDNDGDGLTDFPLDPACASADDDGEGLPACSDGVDNDCDGATDEDDPACYGALYNSEGQGDRFGASAGTSRCDDPAATPASGVQGERFGPFTATVVPSTAGRFVYVLDRKRSKVEVIDATAAAFAPVPVNDWAADAPAPAFSVPQGVKTFPLYDIRAAAHVGPSLQGDQDITLPSRAGALAAVETTGDLWFRNIQPDPALGRAAAARGTFDASVVRGCAVSTCPTPPADGSGEPCVVDPVAAANPDLCVRPIGDEENWLVGVTLLNGTVATIRAIARGVPIHRLQQLSYAPSGRQFRLATRPALSLRGIRVDISSWPIDDAAPPVLGPSLQEKVPIPDDAASDAPQTFRDYGIWPPDDPEAGLNESWSVQYEGTIPGAGGRLGRFTTPTRFVAPDQRFCERGVVHGDSALGRVGDWLLVAGAPGYPALDPMTGEPTPTTLAPALAQIPALTVGEGAAAAACPVKRLTGRWIQVPIVEVGQDWVEVDPTGAQLVPPALSLDLDAIREAGLSVDACVSALDAYDQTRGLPQSYTAVPQLTPDLLPAVMRYEVRSSGSWVVTGSRSGFLHRNRWSAGACTIDDPTGDPRTVGRAWEAELAEGAAYPECPLRSKTQTGITAACCDDQNLLAADDCPTGDDGTPITACTAAEGKLISSANRFVNHAFGLDVLPACAVDPASGAISLATTHRDTRWSFAPGSGVDSPRVYSPARSDRSPIGSTTRGQQVEHRGELVIIDTANDAVRIGRWITGIFGEFRPLR